MSVQEENIDKIIQYGFIRHQEGKLAEAESAYQEALELGGKNAELYNLMGVLKLQENDVISVAYDVTNDFADSSFYDIIVTRGTVEGKVTSHDVDNKTYTVGGITYKYDENRLPSGFYRNAVGIDAKVYIDAFGRIVLLNEIALPEKYAILD